MKRQILICLLCSSFTGIVSAAPNKVVVIPLAGDDTAQQYLEFGESTTGESEGCQTGTYFTHKTKTSQVKAIASGSIRFVNDETSWQAVPMYSRNFANFQVFPEATEIRSGGSASQYSSNTNTKHMSLEPDSNYRFKIDYKFEGPNNASTCTLLLEFSFETSNVVDPFIIIVPF